MDGIYDGILSGYDSACAFLPLWTLLERRQERSKDQKKQEIYNGLNSWRLLSAYAEQYMDYKQQKWLTNALKNLYRTLSQVLTSIELLQSPSLFQRRQYD